MAAAAPRPPFPATPELVSECRHLSGKAPMHQRPARDSKGMDTFARRQERS